MAAEPSNYHRGEMDIHEQRRTYQSFLSMSKWGSLAIIVGVLFFSLLFAIGVGFIGSAISAFVVLVLGILILKEKRKTPG